MTSITIGRRGKCFVSHPSRGTPWYPAGLDTPNERHVIATNPKKHRSASGPETPPLRVLGSKHRVVYIGRYHTDTSIYIVRQTARLEAYGGGLYIFFPSPFPFQHRAPSFGEQRIAIYSHLLNLVLTL